ncbi:hypothetical protein P0W64_07805 [Tsukamurella sp. 8F]|uniref:SecDF P1 head subdomain-containing protein n=1 Tax=unclassified Tsukamurella TaxID=2633480 RepID=UPI0023B8BD52|nr:MULTISPECIES: hypothetical protein [unclassified Tsukamurella]MDF0528838.1 hypothetical protein [Tsukamurella sp. 8J]MDF0586673.1 hypothetical protein [Tsukamurella sp. 8F]
MHRRSAVIAASVAVTGAGIIGTGVATAVPAGHTLEFRSVTSSKQVATCPSPSRAGETQPIEACALDGKTLYALAPAMIATTPTAARPERDRTSGRWTVHVTLAPGAAEMVSRYTATHIGEFLALVHDGVVLRAPRIASQSGGEIVLAGGFTQQSATAVAQELRG